MLTMLRHASNPNRIVLTNDFKRDLRWFQKFLLLYNGISMYGHKVSDYTLELDACLTGIGGCWGNLVYHLIVPQGYLDMGIY